MSVMQKTSEGWKRCDSKNGIAMEIYDSNERMIGMYEGKPLYRRIFNISSITLSDSTWVQTDIDSTNIEVFVIGKMIDGNGSKIDVFVGKNNTTNKVQIMWTRNLSAAISNCKMILEYTKTTDSPIDINRLDIISQNLYDGEEHQIGMWFGKPLYRKCFIQNCTVETTLINHGIQNLGIIRNIESMFKRTSDSIWFGCNQSQGTGSGVIHLYTVCTDTQLSFIRSSTYGNGTAYITVEYTKTTD